MRTRYKRVRVAVCRCSLHSFVMISVTPIDKRGQLVNGGRRVLGGKCCGRWDTEIASWRTDVVDLMSEISEAIK